MRYAHIKNAALVALGGLGGAAFSFVNITMVSKHLSVQGFGEFNSFLVATQILGQLSLFGFNIFLLRFYSSNSDSGARKRALAAVSRIVFCVGISSAVVCILFCIYFLDRSILLSVCVGILVFAQLYFDMITSCCQVGGNYLKQFWAQLLPHLTRSIALMVAVSISMSFDLLFFSLVCAYLVYLMFFLKESLLIFSSLFYSGDVNTRHVFYELRPIALAGFFHMLYYNGYVLLVAFLSDNVNVAYYSVAFNVVMAIYFCPNVIFQKYVLGHILHLKTNAYYNFSKIFFKINIFMFFLGVIAFLVVLFWHSQLLSLLFGHGYHQAGFVLVVLAIGIPFRFLATSLASDLISNAMMWKKVRIMGLVAVLSTIGAVVFIPSYGALGAAVVSVFSEFVLVSMYAFLVASNWRAARGY